MKKTYPYYELKNAIDEFVIEYGDLMTKQKWSITSKPCPKCDKTFDVKIRETDERYFYTTTSGKKKKNIDYLFVEREQSGKLTKGINQFLNNFGFEIDPDGLIINYTKNDTGNSIS
jgi:hypothetical protein